MTRGAVCVNRARTDLWEPRVGNRPGPPDIISIISIIHLIGGDVEISIGSGIPHRAAFVLRRTSGGDPEHVAGLMPLLDAQPPVPLHAVD